jgi:prostaglandin-endoperoxide synthase 2
MRGDGEYPPYLCQDAKVKQEFNELPAPFGFDGLTPDEKDALFAMGTDTRNLGFMAFNVLFLREHNRIVRQLREEHGGWRDDQLFETTRNILIMVLIKVVVEDYINHINPSPYQLRLAPASFSKAPWFRPNWMAIEFNLLYRWHSLVPSSFELDGRRLTIEESLSNSQALIDSGLGQFMVDASSQPAGRISLYSTDPFLVRMAEKPSIEQGRAAELRSYNDYRKMCGRPAVTSFLEINSDPRVQEGLAEVYGSVDEIEFYVGLFAEEAGRLDVLPPLVHTMVAFDAFSQALTNPLAAPRVFNEETFTATGMAIINDTKRIADIVERNVPAGSDLGYVSLTQSLFKRY